MPVFDCYYYRRRTWKTMSNEARSKEWAWEDTE